MNILLIDESADWKHVLSTSANATKYSERNGYFKEGTKKENPNLKFFLLENDHYIQARNIFLMKVLCTEDSISAYSRVNSFTSLLYNSSIDEEALFVMKSTLKR